MSVQETDELRDAVSGGEFPNAEAAVTAALDVWTVDRMINRLGVDHLRTRWQEGIASGDPRPLDVDQLMREILAAKRERVGST